MDKRVLFITHKYPPSIGGMQKQSYELLTGMEKHLPVEKLVWHDRLTVPYFILKGAGKKARALMQQKPIHLIHLNDGSMTMGINSLKKHASAPILSTFHGLDLIFPNPLYQKLMIPRIKKLDKVITVSTETKTECLKRGIQEDRIVVIPNGVDTDMSQIPRDPAFGEKLEDRIGIPLQDKKILLSVGRPVPRKGVYWFMEKVMGHLPKDAIYLVVGAPLKSDKFLRSLINFLPKRWANQLALIYGIGLDRPEQLRLRVSERLRNRVFLLGKVPYEDLVQLYKHADLFLMPNIPVAGDMEGFGLTALEASVNGTVVVASRLEGIPDAVKDGKNGILIAPLDEAAWISKIDELLGKTTELCKLAQKFQTYTVAHYSWDRMVSRYLELFKEYL